MSANSRFKAIQGALAGLLAVSVIVWLLLRPLAVTAGPQVVAAIDLTGQIRGTVMTTVTAVRQLTTIDGNTPSETVMQRRETVNGLVAACERLGGAVNDADSAWLPVAEAVVLLHKTQEFAALGLSKTPTVQVPAQAAAGVDSLETDPNKTGMTRETAALIESRASDLLTDAEHLFVAVRQSALRAAFSRGAWLGLEARDYLLGCVLLAVLIGYFVTWQAQTLWSTPPAHALEAELRLLAHGEPQAAVERCFARSGELLKLADTFLIQANLRKGGADVAPGTSAR